MPGESARENGKKGGRPAGTKNPATFTKEAAREALRQIVLAQMHDMASAQIAAAKGLRYLVTRDRKSGKFIRVTEAMAKAKSGADDDEETIEVWEKDPSVQAFTDLMNRALDKPKEQEQVISISGELTIVEARLLTARKRLAAQNP